MKITIKFPVPEIGREAKQLQYLREVLAAVEQDRSPADEVTLEWVRR